ncbi:colicin V synthesis protein [Xylella taiwanensis]|uniref:Colicin V synthesis protein n=1 Tax=Xylella taiwanensis TaxID=1444770 RepID=Z9JKN7_9GAMM|nr:hypothetical protein [Xylella taiwanensis]AXI82687.1 colicin V synthesis protein [Xylella taiwanensis]EWS78327.1 colicin V synthesis protein [Xylella taiwanensis]MCD8455683.1 colicin V synthesis protein [Xylella taiwanensis]MCD8458090.1 colicin V synthesis protein [Xylella taiwanensis]MCD8460226.1 colicin V synthesis protein [Xylella taiwanensis]
MRELTLAEIDNVSGADFGTRLEAAIVGSIVAGWAGSIWGGTRGGDGGGIIGIGTIGQGVGMLYGGLLGVVGGFVGGFILDKTATYNISTSFGQSVFNGTFAK